MSGFLATPSSSLEDETRVAGVDMAKRWIKAAGGGNQ